MKTEGRVGLGILEGGYCEGDEVDRGVSGMAWVYE